VKGRQLAAGLPAAVVAVVAGLVSFGHIESLALSVHQPIGDARLLPLSVDGLIVAGSVVVLAGYALGWLPVAAGVAATLFANVESGLPYGPLAAVVAAWPAVAFTVASFTLERWLKSQVGRVARSGPEWPAGGPRVAREPYGDDTKLALDNPAEPPPDHPEGCRHEGGSTAEEKVVNGYLHERDCLGRMPSQRRLSDDHGVSRRKVAALVGPLNGHGSNDDT